MSEEYFYHYTNYEFAKKIFLNGKIKPSKRINGDAVHGDGVYLTTLDPRNGKDVVGKNNWDGIARNNDHKMECYFEILIPSSKVTRAKEKRDIQVYPGELVLSDYMWSLKDWAGDLLATEHFMVRSEGKAAENYPKTMGRYTLCKWVVMPDKTPVYEHNDRKLFLYKKDQIWFIGPVVGNNAGYLIQHSEDSPAPKKTIPWRYAHSNNELKIDETLRVDPIYENHDAIKKRKSAGNSCARTKRRRVAHAKRRRVDSDDTV